MSDPYTKGKDIFDEIQEFDVVSELDSEEMIVAYLAEFANDAPEVVALANENARRARARLAGQSTNPQEPK